MDACLKQCFVDPGRRTAHAGCILVVGLGFLAAGCGRTTSSPASASQEGKAAANSPYRLTGEPEGARDLNAVHADAKDGEDVVVAARVGGRGNPWVEELAAFTIVDRSSTPQASCCPTPSPGCGTTNAPPAAQALVRIVDAQGHTVTTDARRLLGIDGSPTVVVRGRAQRDEAGNLTVLADGVFVRP